MQEPAASTLATRLIEWYAGSARDLPWRHPEFGAWGVLVSEFMLQQTPVNRVIPMLEAWLGRWPTPAALAAATPAEAVHQWANLGYPRRALWLREAAAQITDRHDGVVVKDAKIVDWSMDAVRIRVPEGLTGLPARLRRRAAR